MTDADSPHFPHDFDRRHFLKIMGASFGLAGMGALAGCREPRNRTLPYAKQPENSVPGIPVYYATSFPGARANEPLIVETHQHRPTKIEGNPSHAPTGGATSKFAQASILDLYDPDRAQFSVGANNRQLERADVAAALKELAGDAEKSGGDGLCFLAEPSTSPTRARLVAMLKKKFPKAIWSEYSPADESGGDRVLSDFFKTPVRAKVDFSKAKRVLAIDADFLGTGDEATAHARAFAKTRAVESPADAAAMSRLYAAESVLSLTGAAAEHRLRLATSEIGRFVFDLASAIAGSLVNLARFEITPKEKTKTEIFIESVAADLLENKGASVVIAGAHLPAGVHRLVALINEKIGAVGKILNYVSAPEITGESSSAGDLRRLTESRVETFVILAGNPCYNAPADLNFSQFLKTAKRVVRLGYHDAHCDETAAATIAHAGGLFIAGTHYLEQWGDGRASDGAYVPVQPMIEPIYDGFSEIEILSLWLGLAGDARSIVKETFAGFAKNIGIENTDAAFVAWLAEGVLAGTEFKIEKLPPVSAGDLSKGRYGKLGDNAGAPAAKNLEVRILPSPHTHDGRFSNNGWLQEIPDPLLKTCWENVIAISPKLAGELGITPAQLLITKLGGLESRANEVEDGKFSCPVATLALGEKTVRGPVFVAPGLADYTVAVTLGFGRRQVGRVGARVPERENSGKIVGIGFDVYPLVSSKNPAVCIGATLTLTGEKVFVCNTQEHGSQEGRDIVRETLAGEFMKNPAVVAGMGIEAHSPKIYGKDAGASVQEKATAQPRGNSAYETPQFGKPFPNVAVWKNHEAEFPAQPQYGMSIDLNKCIGCHACVAACRSENNIPIVGRDQVLRGRSMDWIRIDRYFSGGVAGEVPEDPQVNFMSLACVNCELAPCESVCPVNATVHDQNGLNVMAYNRCVGTRYCANNCPYKVRRFNFFDYGNRQIGHFYEGPLGPKGKPELQKMQMNPDVTVRMRGVMEKCTYCVQRIQEEKIRAKINAKNSGDIAIADDAIRTACQQVCPADAIVFGDISDAGSAVSKAKNNPRTYSLLGYLNTRPRTTFLAKLRNPNPKFGARNETKTEAGDVVVEG